MNKETGGQTRLLLVDDHTLFRESLRRLLESEKTLVVAGDFSSSEAALSAVAGGLEFDVALLDYELTLEGRPEDNGCALVRKLRGLRPESRILMVTAGMATDELVRSVVELEVGIFLKTEPTEELIVAIGRTVQGERWISSRAALTLFKEQQGGERPVRGESAWTSRELRVLQGVLEGRTNKEIGAVMEMTESSIKAVLQKLFEKTGVRSRSQLVRYAIEAQIETK